MTKHNYEDLAHAFVDSRPSRHADLTTEEDKAVYTALCQQWEQDVSGIADVLASDNPRFDRRLFLSACTETT